MKSHHFMNTFRRKHDYDLPRIGNGDKTPVWFYVPENTTTDFNNTRSVSVRTTSTEQQRCILMCIMADGRKLAPYVFLRELMNRLRQGPAHHHLNRLSRDPCRNDKGSVVAQCFCQLAIQNKLPPLSLWLQVIMKKPCWELEKALLEQVCSRFRACGV